MPRSKRDKKVSLTKTTKKGLVLKQKIVEDIRKAVTKYENIFVFSINDMRNAKLKDLRSEWKDSRFFFGKNKVMSLALGKTESDELENQLNLLSKELRGQCGLLLTDKSTGEVVEWFKEFSELDYARSGFVATKDVVLPAGPLEGFSHAIEPHLRRLGLPTSLDKGVITLIKEHQVCKQGTPLTPEQASVLKLLEIKMANFKLVVKCHWSKSQGFSQCEVNNGSDDDEANVAMEEDET